MASMMMNEGNMVPRAMKNAPQNLRSLYPMKMAMFTAKMPGTVCANAMRSMKSSRETHFCLSMISASISGIIAYPPPMVKRPMRENMQNDLK